MKWTVGMKIGSGFGLALVILAIIGGVSYRSTVTLTDSAERVTHTHEVLGKLEAVLSDMSDAQNGTRGYTITGEERFLEPYNAALSMVHQDLSALRELTPDVNQQRRLDVLQPLIDGKDGLLVHLQGIVEARKDQVRGFDAALRLVRAGTGEKVMGDIRRVVGEMEKEERTVLATRSADALASARIAKLTTIAVPKKVAVAARLAALRLRTVASLRPRSRPYVDQYQRSLRPCEARFSPPSASRGLEIHHLLHSRAWTRGPSACSIRESVA